MKITKEKLEKSEVLLKIEADPQETEAYLDKAYRRLVNRVLVPGFRKGKAPRLILERHIGKEALLQEALERMVPELYQKAALEQQVEAVAEPDIHVTKTDPVSFEAHIPVKPTVELGDYKSIRVPVEPAEVKEPDVNNYLENLREQNAIWEPVQRPVEVGDRVTLEVQGTVEGKKIMDEKGWQITLFPGARLIVPGFVEKLVGMAAEEENEFELPFPEDYRKKELAGESCLFKVKAKDIKGKKLAELNDEFAKSLSWGVETLEALKTKVQADLKQAKEMLSRRKQEGQVLEVIVAASKVEYPPVLVEREIKQLVKETVRFSGIDNLERYLAQVKKTQEELKDEVREQAQKRVLNTIVLEKISEEEKIEVAEAEIDKEIENIVKVNAAKGPEVAQGLNSPAARESIRSNMRQRKTLELLSKIATSPETPESVPVSGAEEKASE